MVTIKKQIEEAHRLISEIEKEKTWARTSDLCDHLRSILDFINVLHDCEKD